MKITVERRSEDEKLVFTITCTDPHYVPFGEAEKTILLALQTVNGIVDGTLGPDITDTRLQDDVKTLIHGAKEKAFDRVQKSLNSSILNELQPKFIPMQQEIYNWIYDHQKDLVKQWMIEFDPQRTKYYFDNDRTADSDDLDD